MLYVSSATRVLCTEISISSAKFTQCLGTVAVSRHLICPIFVDMYKLRHDFPFPEFHRESCFRQSTDYQRVSRGECVQQLPTTPLFHPPPYPSLLSPAPLSPIVPCSPSLSPIPSCSPSHPSLSSRLQASNSSTYVQDAFLLLLPVLQLGTIEAYQRSLSPAPAPTAS